MRHRARTRRYAPGMRPAPRPARAAVAVLAALGTAALLGACGGDGGSGGPDISGKEFEDLTGRDEVTVDAVDNRFVPEYVEIDAGTTVRFENRGRNVHNVIPAEDGAFEPVEADELGPGDTAEVTFDEPGLYPYYCSLHGTTTKGMIGGIRVRG